MLRYEAVLFDNGQTLFYRSSAVASIVELARQSGVSVSERDARQVWATVKSKRKRGPEERLRRNSSRAAHRDYYITQYAPLDGIAPGLAELFYTHHKTSPRTMLPYPDTPEVLAVLRDAGLRIGVVSNTGWDISQGYAVAGLGGLIDTWVLSWQHGTAKPDPWLFAHACGRLRVKPARALMVGNDAEADGGAAVVGATVLILPEVRPGEQRGLRAVLDLVGLAAPERTGPGPSGAPDDSGPIAQLAV